MYNYFATVYDKLMTDFPYELWEEFVYENFSNENRVLDIGCGTGTLLKRIEKNNYFGIGLDISNEMLTIARDKCANFEFYEYDIREKINFKNAKCVSCFVDSINYILKEEDVINFFNEIYNIMDNDSIFLLDFHTIKKINENFLGHEEYQIFPEFEFDWKSVKGPIENSVIHKMKFVDNSNEYQEEHTQISFGKEFYIENLKKAGFDVSIDKRTDDLRVFVKCYKK